MNSFAQTQRSAEVPRRAPNHHPLVVCAWNGLGRGLRHEGLLSMAVEPRLLVEPQCPLVFSTGEQHDLVAVLAPRFAKSMRKNSLAPALATMLRMRHDILDDAVRSAGAREVRNDGERATRDERAGGKATEVFDSRIGDDLRPNSRDHCRRWQWVVAFVQVHIQTEQRLKLVRLEFTDVHVSGPTLESGQTTLSSNQTPATRNAAC